jgi:hypothetical protein
LFFEEFNERISASQDKTLSLISLSVEYYSPEMAKQWTDELVRTINVHIQKQDREEAITSITDMQSVFY